VEEKRCEGPAAAINQPSHETIAMKICMLSYSFYETDARVKRYGESLVERGDEVDAICLRRNGTLKEETLRGVRVYRIQGRSYDEKSKWSYLSRILRFLFKSAVFLTRRHLRTKYDLIHVHNVPDFLVFSAIVLKLLGCRIILDIHDILPEFYANKFRTNKTGAVFKAMVLVEKLSASFSNHVIISNHLWEKTLISRSVKPANLSVYMNYPDDSIFYPRRSERNNGRLIMMYPGTLNWHQGVDIAIKAFALLKDEVPELDFHIYGIGKSKAELEKLVEDLGLRERVIFPQFLPLDGVPEVMAGADIGVVPKRDDSFGGEAFSTKILQFMSMGIPVVVSKTRIDQYYFNDSVVKFFKPGDEQDLADRIKNLAIDKKARDHQAENALDFVKDLAWSRKKQDYLDLVDCLVNNTPRLAT
jgi:glycosyltransferase involved in cell wall biosynthesis